MPQHDVANDFGRSIHLLICKCIWTCGKPEARQFPGPAPLLPDGVRGEGEAEEVDAEDAEGVDHQGQPGL